MSVRRAGGVEEAVEKAAREVLYCFYIQTTFRVSKVYSSYGGYRNWYSFFLKRVAEDVLPAKYPPLRSAREVRNHPLVKGLVREMDKIARQLPGQKDMSKRHRRLQELVAEAVAAETGIPLQEIREAQERRELLPGVRSRLGLEEECLRRLRGLDEQVKRRVVDILAAHIVCECEEGRRRSLSRFLSECLQDDLQIPRSSFNKIHGKLLDAGVISLRERADLKKELVSSGVGIIYPDGDEYEYDVEVPAEVLRLLEPCIKKRAEEIRRDSTLPARRERAKERLRKFLREVFRAVGKGGIDGRDAVLTLLLVVAWRNKLVSTEKDLLKAACGDSVEYNLGWRLGVGRKVKNIMGDVGRVFEELELPDILTSGILSGDDILELIEDLVEKYWCSKARRFIEQNREFALHVKECVKKGKIRRGYTITEGEFPDSWPIESETITRLGKDGSLYYEMRVPRQLVELGFCIFVPTKSIGRRISVALVFPPCVRRMLSGIRRGKVDRKLAYLQALDHEGLVKLVGNLLERRGYTTTITSGPKDLGLDLVARKEGEVVGVQVKTLRQGKVGPGTVREVVGSRPPEVTGLLVVTNRDFSDEARKTAQKLSEQHGIPIELWNRERLRGEL